MADAEKTTVILSGVCALEEMFSDAAFRAELVEDMAVGCLVGGNGPTFPCLSLQPGI